MKILKKTLYLQYKVQKGEREVTRSHPFKVRADIDDAALESLGTELKNLFKEQIVNIVLDVREEIK